MKERIVFIDLLRGWAALVMIEVHVLNAFLRPGEKQAYWFEVLNFVNGLVAPAFLFVAGLVFVVASERKLEEFRSFGSAFRKQVWRIFLILVVGYVLHLPVFSFTTLLQVTGDGWGTFYQSDILHCIAAGLAVLFVFRLTVRDTRSLSALIGLVGLGVVLGAPYLWQSDLVNAVHPAIAAYLSDKSGSLFPLFPWLGFLLFGGLVGIGYLQAEHSGYEKGFGLCVLFSALVLLSFYGLQLLVTGPWFPGSRLQSDPLFFGMRLGLILLLLLLCRQWVRWRKTEKSFVLDAGRESLLVYVVHLTIIYGTFLGGRSLSEFYGGKLSIAEALVSTGLLMIMMIAVAKGWGRIKTHSRALSRGIVIAGSVIVTLFFFIQ